MATVTIPVKAQTSGLKEALLSVNKSFEKTEKSAKKASSVSFNSQTRSIGASNKALSSMNTTLDRQHGLLKRVAIAGGSYFAVTGFLHAANALNGAADRITSNINRIALITGRGSELQKTMKRLREIGQDTNSAFGDGAQTFFRFGMALRDSGKYKNTHLLQAADTVQKALVISGGPPESGRAAIFQLGQGIAANALRGQELNSVLEQAPRIAMAIADELEVGVGQLRAMAGQGKITADVVMQAMLNQAQKINKEFANINPTIAMRRNVMKDQIDRLVSSVYRLLLLDKLIIKTMDTIGSAAEKVADGFYTIINLRNKSQNADKSKKETATLMDTKNLDWYQPIKITPVVDSYKVNEAIESRLEKIKSEVDDSIFDFSEIEFAIADLDFSILDDKELSKFFSTLTLMEKSVEKANKSLASTGLIPPEQKQMIKDDYMEMARLIENAVSRQKLKGQGFGSPFSKENYATDAIVKEAKPVSSKLKDIIDAISQSLKKVGGFLKDFYTSSVESGGKIVESLRGALSRFKESIESINFSAFKLRNILEAIKEIFVKLKNFLSSMFGFKTAERAQAVNQVQPDKVRQTSRDTINNFGTYLKGLGKVPDKLPTLSIKESFSKTFDSLNIKLFKPVVSSIEGVGRKFLNQDKRDLYKKNISSFIKAGLTGISNFIVTPAGASTLDSGASINKEKSLWDIRKNQNIMEKRTLDWHRSGSLGKWFTEKLVSLDKIRGRVPKNFDLNTGVWPIVKGYQYTREAMGPRIQKKFPTPLNNLDYTHSAMGPRVQASYKKKDLNLDPIEKLLKDNKEALEHYGLENISTKKDVIKSVISEIFNIRKSVDLSALDPSREWKSIVTMDSKSKYPKFYLGQEQTKEERKASPGFWKNMVPISPILDQAVNTGLVSTKDIFSDEESSLFKGLTSPLVNKMIESGIIDIDKVLSEKNTGQKILFKVVLLYERVAKSVSKNLRDTLQSIKDFFIKLGIFIKEFITLLGQKNPIDAFKDSFANFKDSLGVGGETEAIKNFGKKQLTNIKSFYKKISKFMKDILKKIETFFIDFFDLLEIKSPLEAFKKAFSNFRESFDFSDEKETAKGFGSKFQTNMSYLRDKFLTNKYNYGVEEAEFGFLENKIYDTSLLEDIKNWFSNIFRNLNDGIKSVLDKIKFFFHAINVFIKDLYVSLTFGRAELSEFGFEPIYDSNMAAIKAAFGRFRNALSGTLEEEYKAPFHYKIISRIKDNLRKRYEKLYMEDRITPRGRFSIVRSKQDKRKQEDQVSPIVKKLKEVFHVVNPVRILDTILKTIESWLKKLHSMLAEKLGGEDKVWLAGLLFLYISRGFKTIFAAMYNFFKYLFVFDIVVKILSVVLENYEDLETVRKMVKSIGDYFGDIVHVIMSNILRLHLVMKDFVQGFLESFGILGKGLFWLMGLFPISYLAGSIVILNILLLRFKAIGKMFKSLGKIFKGTFSNKKTTPAATLVREASPNAALSVGLLGSAAILKTFDGSIEALAHGVMSLTWVVLGLLLPLREMTQRLTGGSPAQQLLGITRPGANIRNTRSAAIYGWQSAVSAPQAPGIKRTLAIVSGVVAIIFIESILNAFKELNIGRRFSGLFSISSETPGRMSRAPANLQRMEWMKDPTENYRKIWDKDKAREASSFDFDPIYTMIFSGLAGLVAGITYYKDSVVDIANSIESKMSPRIQRVTSNIKSWGVTVVNADNVFSRILRTLIAFRVISWSLVGVLVSVAVYFSNFGDIINKYIHKFLNLKGPFERSVGVYEDSDGFMSYNVGASIHGTKESEPSLLSNIITKIINILTDFYLWFSILFFGPIRKLLHKITLSISGFLLGTRHITLPKRFGGKTIGGLIPTVPTPQKPTSSTVGRRAHANPKVAKKIGLSSTTGTVAPTRSMMRAYNNAILRRDLAQQARIVTYGLPSLFEGGFKNLLKNGKLFVIELGSLFKIGFKAILKGLWAVLMANKLLIAIGIIVGIATLLYTKASHAAEKIQSIDFFSDEASREVAKKFNKRIEDSLDQTTTDALERRGAVGEGYKKTATGPIETSGQPGVDLRGKLEKRHAVSPGVIGRDPETGMTDLQRKILSYNFSNMSEARRQRFSITMDRFEDATNKAKESIKKFGDVTETDIKRINRSYKNLMKQLDHQYIEVDTGKIAKSMLITTGNLLNTLGFSRKLVYSQLGVNASYGYGKATSASPSLFNLKGSEVFNRADKDPIGAIEGIIRGIDQILIDDKKSLIRNFTVFDRAMLGAQQDLLDFSRRVLIAESALKDFGEMPSGMVEDLDSFYKSNTAYLDLIAHSRDIIVQDFKNNQKALARGGTPQGLIDTDTAFVEAMVQNRDTTEVWLNSLMSSTEPLRQTNFFGRDFDYLSMRDTPSTFLQPWETSLLPEEPEINADYAKQWAALLGDSLGKRMSSIPLNDDTVRVIKEQFPYYHNKIIEGVKSVVREGGRLTDTQIDFLTKITNLKQVSGERFLRDAENQIGTYTNIAHTFDAMFGKDFQIDTFLDMTKADRELFQEILPSLEKDKYQIKLETDYTNLFSDDQLKVKGLHNFDDTILEKVRLVVNESQQEFALRGFTGEVKNVTDEINSILSAQGIKIDFENISINPKSVKGFEFLKKRAILLNMEIGRATDPVLKKLLKAQLIDVKLALTAFEGSPVDEVKKAAEFLGLQGDIETDIPGFLSENRLNTFRALGENLSNLQLALRSGDISTKTYIKNATYFTSLWNTELESTHSTMNKIAGLMGTDVSVRDMFALPSGTKEELIGLFNELEYLKNLTQTDSFWGDYSDEQAKNILARIEDIENALQFKGVQFMPVNKLLNSLKEFTGFDIDMSSFAKLDPAKIEGVKNLALYLKRTKSLVDKFSIEDLNSESPAFKNLIDNLEKGTEILKRELRTFDQVVKQISKIVGVELDSEELSRIISEKSARDMERNADAYKMMEDNFYKLLSGDNPFFDNIDGVITLSLQFEEDLEKALKDAAEISPELGVGSLRTGTTIDSTALDSTLLSKAASDLVSSMVDWEKQGVLNRQEDLNNLINTHEILGIDKHGKQINVGGGISTISENSNKLNKGIEDLSKHLSESNSRAATELIYGRERVSPDYYGSKGGDLEGFFEARNKAVDVIVEKEIESGLSVFFRKITGKTRDQAPHFDEVAEGITSVAGEPLENVEDMLKAARTWMYSINEQQVSPQSGFMHGDPFDPKNLTIYNKTIADLEKSTGKFAKSVNFDYWTQFRKNKRNQDEIVQNLMEKHEITEKTAASLLDWVGGRWDMTDFKDNAEGLAHFNSELTHSTLTFSQLYDVYSQFSESPVSLEGFLSRGQIDLSRGLRTELLSLRNQMKGAKTEGEYLELFRDATKIEQDLNRINSSYTSLVESIVSLSFEGTTSEGLFNLDDQRLQTLFEYNQKILQLQDQLSVLPTTVLSEMQQRHKRDILGQLDDLKSAVSRETLTYKFAIDTAIGLGEGIDFEYIALNYDENQLQGLMDDMAEKMKWDTELANLISVESTLDPLTDATIKTVEATGEKFNEVLEEIVNPIDSTWETGKSVADRFIETFNHVSSVWEQGVKVAEKFQTIFEKNTTVSDNKKDYQGEASNFVFSENKPVKGPGTVTIKTRGDIIGDAVRERENVLDGLLGDMYTLSSKIDVAKSQKKAGVLSIFGRKNNEIYEMQDTLDSMVDTFNFMDKILSSRIDHLKKGTYNQVSKFKTKDGYHAEAYITNLDQNEKYKKYQDLYQPYQGPDFYTKAKTVKRNSWAWSENQQRRLFGFVDLEKIFYESLQKSTKGFNNKRVTHSSNLENFMIKENIFTDFEKALEHLTVFMMDEAKKIPADPLEYVPLGGLPSGENIYDILLGGFDSSIKPGDLPNGKNLFKMIMDGITRVSPGQLPNGKKFYEILFAGLTNVNPEDSPNGENFYRVLLEGWVSDIEDILPSGESKYKYGPTGLNPFMNEYDSSLRPDGSRETDLSRISRNMFKANEQYAKHGIDIYTKIGSFFDKTGSEATFLGALAGGMNMESLLTRAVTTKTEPPKFSQALFEQEPDYLSTYEISIKQWYQDMANINTEFRTFGQILSKVSGDLDKFSLLGQKDSLDKKVKFIDSVDEYFQQTPASAPKAFTREGWLSHFNINSIEAPDFLNDLSLSDDQVNSQMAAYWRARVFEVEEAGRSLANRFDSAISRTGLSISKKELLTLSPQTLDQVRSLETSLSHLEKVELSQATSVAELERLLTKQEELQKKQFELLHQAANLTTLDGLMSGQGINIDASSYKFLDQETWNRVYAHYDNIRGLQDRINNLSRDQVNLRRQLQNELFNELELANKILEKEKQRNMNLKRFTDTLSSINIDPKRLRFTSPQQNRELARMASRVQELKIEQESLLDPERGPMTEQDIQLYNQNQVAIEEMTRAMEQYSYTVGYAVDSTREGFKDIFHEVMTGTRSLSDGLKGWLDSLKNMFIRRLSDMVANNLLDSILGAVPRGHGGGGGGGFLGSLVGGLFGGLGFFSDGGPVAGPGGPRDDKIPAMLSDGEFVINASATKKFGPLLNGINKYKDGGPVGKAIGNTLSFGPSSPEYLQIKQLKEMEKNTDAIKATGKNTQKHLSSIRTNTLSFGKLKPALESSNDQLEEAIKENTQTTAATSRSGSPAITRKAVSEGVRGSENTKPTSTVLGRKFFGLEDPRYVNAEGDVVYNINGREVKDLIPGTWPHTMDTLAGIGIGANNPGIGMGTSMGISALTGNFLAAFGQEGYGGVAENSGKAIGEAIGFFAGKALLGGGAGGLIGSLLGGKYLRNLVSLPEGFNKPFDSIPGPVYGAGLGYLIGGGSGALIGGLLAALTGGLGSRQASQKSNDQPTKGFFNKLFKDNNKVLTGAIGYMVGGIPGAIAGAILPGLIKKKDTSDKSEGDEKGFLGGNTSTLLAGGLGYMLGGPIGALAGLAMTMFKKNENTQKKSGGFLSNLFSGSKSATRAAEKIKNSQQDLYDFVNNEKLGSLELSASSMYNDLYPKFDASKPWETSGADRARINALNEYRKRIGDDAEALRRLQRWSNPFKGIGDTFAGRDKLSYRPSGSGSGGGPNNNNRNNWRNDRTYTRTSKPTTKWTPTNYQSGRNYNQPTVSKPKKKGIFGMGGFLGIFADGGPVIGPGTGTSDSIPALLSNGEFVINAKATKRNLPLLENINNGMGTIQNMSKFATGGRAGTIGSTVSSGDVITSMDNAQSALAGNKQVNSNNNSQITQNINLVGSLEETIIRTVVEQSELLADALHQVNKDRGYVNV